VSRMMRAWILLREMAGRVKLTWDGRQLVRLRTWRTLAAEGQASVKAAGSTSVFSSFTKWIRGTRTSGCTIPHISVV
jgi:hypothetical protein